MSPVLDLPASRYHADDIGADRPSLSSSLVHTMVTNSPAHAWQQHPKLNPAYQRVEADKFDYGTAAHALILQGTSIVAVYEHADEWRTNAAKKFKAEARVDGKIPMLAHQWERVREMVAAANHQLAAQHVTPPLFQNGKAEQTLVWEDEDGVWCRALVDWLHDDGSAIDDYKTTGMSASPDAWARTMFAIGGDIQVAFYLRGARALLDREPQWRYVVQETCPPFALQVFTPGPDVLAVADAKVEWAIRRWARCMETGKWPSYPTRVATVELPPWEEARWLEREAREEAAA